MTFNVESKKIYDMYSSFIIDLKLPSFLYQLIFSIFIVSLDIIKNGVTGS